MTNGAKSHGPRPDYCFDRVVDINPAWFATVGIKGLLLDIDNTLTRWENDFVPPDEMAWLEQLDQTGIPCRLISNGLSSKRSKIVEQTRIAQVRGLAVKPMPAAFRLAVHELGLPASEVLMIGDIIITDIWPANRGGLWTCLVNPLSPIDFAGTKAWRLVERVCHWRNPLRTEHDFRQAEAKEAETSR